jgi:hypothetical protein
VEQGQGEDHASGGWRGIGRVSMSMIAECSAAAIIYAYHCTRSIRLCATATRSHPGAPEYLRQDSLNRSSALSALELVWADQTFLRCSYANQQQIFSRAH